MEECRGEGGERVRAPTASSLPRLLTPWTHLVEPLLVQLVVVVRLRLQPLVPRLHRVKLPLDPPQVRPLPEAVGLLVKNTIEQTVEFGWYWSLV